MRKERKHAIICLDRLNVMKSNTALDPAFHGLRNPLTRFQFFIIGTKIADAKSSWNSGFLERYSGYSTSKFRGSLIPEEKISWIPESAFPCTVFFQFFLQTCTVTKEENSLFCACDVI